MLARYGYYYSFSVVKGGSNKKKANCYYDSDDLYIDDFSSSFPLDTFMLCYVMVSPSAPPVPSSNTLFPTMPATVATLLPKLL